MGWGRQRSLRVRSHVHAMLIVSVSCLLLLSTMLLVHREASANAASPNLGPSVYFSDTGHTVSQPFLASWLYSFRDSDLGDPITPGVQINDTFVQWFENGRLEVPVAGIEQATADSVTLAPIGLRYATKIGYTRWNRAFQSIDAGGTEARFFYETRHSLAHDFLTIYERPGNAERLGAPISEEFNIGLTTYQFFEYGALSWSASTGTEFVSLAAMDATLNGYGNDDENVSYDAIDYDSDDMLALSDLFPGERWIQIDLSDHELTAFVGDIELMKTPVITGPPQSPTPVGTHSIYIRYEMQSLTGIGWNGQPYSAPNTPWVMYFVEDFAIHGSTWRTSYGYADGQGCVVPPNDAAEALWKWADYGTKVVVQP